MRDGTESWVMSMGCSVIAIAGCLFGIPILLIAKLTGTFTASWAWVFSPLLLIAAVPVVVLLHEISDIFGDIQMPRNLWLARLTRKLGRLVNRAFSLMFLTFGVLGIAAIPLAIYRAIRLDIPVMWTDLILLAGLSGCLIYGANQLRQAPERIQSLDRSTDEGT